MTAPVSTHAAPTPWFRLAIVETLAGGVLGLATAVVLVVLSLEVFFSLGDFDHDLGLRMRNAYHERMAHWSYGQVSLKTKEAVPSFVFLDVDPEPSLHSQANEAPMAACAALELARRTCVTQGAAPGQATLSQCVAVAETLDCDPGKRVSRALLGSLVAGLRERGARMVVLDVELSDGSSPLPGSRTLRNVLWPVGGAASTASPVIYAWPARYDRTSGESHLVRPEVPWGPARAAPKDAVSAVGATFSALALPAPGQPVRRYPRCYESTGHAHGIVPSIPWLAAWVLKHGASQAPGACEPEVTAQGERFDPVAVRAPYVDFVIPSLVEHLDQSDGSPEFGKSAVYQSMGVRCLASEFWTSQAACGSPRTYAQKVVVIGASNADRRDRHATPIGNMAGAEVLINAIRTFAGEPHVQDKTLAAALAKKAGIVALCLIPWLLYFSLRGYLHSRHSQHALAGNPSHDDSGHGAQASLGRRLGVRLVLALAFAATVLAVVVITVQSSIGSFSVLVGVLAVGIELYIEAAKSALHACETLFRRLLRLPPEPGGHA